MEHMLHIPQTKVLISESLKKQTKSHTKKSLPFRKRRFREKEVRRIGQKQKRIRQKDQSPKCVKTRQKNKRGDIIIYYIGKWDQTDSPEMPDRGETFGGERMCVHKGI